MNRRILRTLSDFVTKNYIPFVSSQTSPDAIYKIVETLL